MRPRKDQSPPAEVSCAGFSSSTASATFWSAADILLRQGAQFVISVLLARLLSPQEFGSIALLYLFTDIAAIPAGSVMAMALIRAQDVSREDECTLFWFNIGAGLTAALVLWFSAPFIATLYATPVLAPLTRIMALSVIAIAAGSIQSALFSRRMEFRSLMWVSLLSVLSSGAVSVIMAYNGFGIWALAAQALTYSATATASLWLLSPWRPAMLFSLTSLRRLCGFSGYMMASTLLNLAYARLYAPLIGKLYGMGELGLYSRAEATSQLPATLLHSVIERVNFPHFSRLAEDKERLRLNVRVAVQSMMAVNAPLMLGLAAVTRPLVLTLFGDKWLPAVPLLQVLCISGLLVPLHGLNLQTLMGLGESRLFFRIEVVKRLLGLFMVAAGSFYGAMGVALAVAFGSVLTFPISAHYTQLYIQYGVLDQICDILPLLIAALLMAFAVLMAGASLNALPPYLQLAVSILLGGVVYTSTLFLRYGRTIVFVKA